MRSLFYSALTGEELIRLPVGPDRETALFAGSGNGGSSGCLFAAPEDQPSHFGSPVQFEANPSIDAWIGRAEQAGGRVLVGRLPAGAIPVASPTSRTAKATGSC